MTPTQDKYPFFEANQVLTNEHLNQAVAFLHEQERLTRANLIGIGIVCGLEITLEAGANTVIRIGKGCGIASEGYLMTEAQDAVLTSYRANYQVPSEPEYAAFIDPVSKQQYPLWELFPAGEPGTTVLGSVPAFLDDKAVVLFLELKKQGLRNCSANNCDDKGAEVTVKIKRLLMQVSDLDKVIAEAGKLAGGSALADFNAALSARLNLPDLHLPRYDVPNGGVATSKQVLGAFQAVFKTAGLVNKTADALSKTYSAFKPVLEQAFPADPFISFNAQFGFLDTVPAAASQVRFLQYYYDFFDDLLQAYDEFRCKGLELMCACCPPEGLFPRHLMLGKPVPAVQPEPRAYRHPFLASPAIGCCEELGREVRQLFRRIVEMIAAFTENPPLPASGQGQIDNQIRITPSKWADVALSDKAIPYYYRQNGAPPLYQLWNALKSRRNKANQNFAYRADEYAPAAPEFIVDALRYDLEAHNFLRIEGHLGKSYQTAMQTLLALRAKYRLPIEIIAVRTGSGDGGSSDQAQNDFLQNFLQQHPGIQHKAGVPPGGTFVLVYHQAQSDSGSDIFSQTVKNIGQDAVIADFYLPYRVTDSKCQPQVAIECEYEWIDSIRHLNNLSLRQYRFTATNKAPAAGEHDRSRLRENYIVRIYKYEIQGKSLLPQNGFVDIEIPIRGAGGLEENKLAAVAAKLNAAFPLGLVFDADSLANKLLIRRLLGQNFRIELGGLQGNQLRYAYENDKIYRWQYKSWEALDNNADYRVNCRILGAAYQEKDYQWLHENYAAKPLAAVSGPTAAEAIEWERLTLMRARKYSAASALPFYNPTLVDIRRAIERIDQGANVVLVGGWANGSWIARSASDNLSSFNEDEEALARFLRLREKVSGKTGYSDIDLLIDSEREITPEMIKVNSGYRINIFRGRKDAQKGLDLE